MVTWSTSTPRSASSSSTSRYDSAKREYQRTGSTITSGGKQKPTKADRGTGQDADGGFSWPQSACCGVARSRCNSATAGNLTHLDNIVAVEGDQVRLLRQPQEPVFVTACCTNAWG